MFERLKKILKRENVYHITLKFPVHVEIPKLDYYGGAIDYRAPLDARVKK